MKRRRSAALWTGGAVLLGGILAVMAMSPREAGKPSAAVQGGEARGPATGPVPPADLGEKTKASSLDQGRGKTREEQEVSIAIAGTVVDEEGNPLEKAAVELVALTARDESWEPAWTEGEWGPLDSPRASTRTDSLGRFRFDSWIGDPAGGEFVLTAALLGFETGTTRSALAGGSPTPVRMVLHRAPAVEVLVLGDQGSPVEGATVLQYGTVGHSGKWKSAGTGVREARYARGSATTDADGLARLPRMQGEQVLVAQVKGRCSLPYQGMPVERVVLRLTPVFEVGGLVSLPDWSALQYEGERRIRVTLRRGGLDRTLAVLRHVEAGPWGPLTVPLVEGADYTVHLEGSPIIPVRVPLDAPTEGKRVRVNLAAELGANIWVLVTDSKGDVLPESEVSVNWEQDGIPNHVTRRSREDGFINLWSVPPVEFAIVASAPGFATEVFPGRSAPPEGDYLDVQLTRAGRVQGRCTCQGKPVSDFAVVSFVTDTRRQSRVQFRGRKEGTFELDAVPLGNVSLVAFSEDLPPSEPVVVRVQEDAAAQVSMELRQGVSRVGEVVDGETGRAIEGARVRRRVVDTAHVDQSWGADIRTDLEGRFRLDAMPEGTVLLDVTAPGYARKLFRVTGAGDTISMPIRIELERPSMLRLQLVGVSPGQAPLFSAACSVFGRELPRRPFDADGLLVYDSVGPGGYRVRVQGGPPERERVVLDVDVVVRPREDTVVPIRVGGPRHVTLDLDVQGVPPPRTGLWARLFYRTGAGKDVILTGPFSEEGVFQADGVDGTTVWADAIRRNGERLGAASGTIPGDSLVLSIASDEEPKRIQVVDALGAPLAAVTVQTFDPQTGSKDAWGGTDRDGWVELYGVLDRDLVVNLHSAVHGDAAGIPLDGRKREEVLVLRGGGILEVRLLNHGSPISGAEGQLMAAHREVYYSLRYSDSQGVLSWDNISPGAYECRFAHPGFWTSRVVLKASTQRLHHTVELRRLTSLSIHVLTPDGVPVAGQALHLVDEVSGEEVDTWIADGRISTSGVATDAEGTIHYDGIPEGRYQVSVGGARTVSTVEARPEGDAEVSLRLPE